MFGRPIPLLTLFGIRIRLDWSWFVIALLLTWSLAVGFFPANYEGLSPQTYWIMGAVGAVALFVCVALHELGHALVARQFGVEMRGITLFIFGGVAEMADEPPTPSAEFWIAIAGPIVSLALAGLFWLALVATWPTAVQGVLRYLAGINVILVLFNMVPAFPLDGGRVLRSILWKIKNSLREATRITSTIGAGFGFALMGLALGLVLLGDLVGAMWSFMLGMFLRGAATMSYQQTLAQSILQGEPVDKFMDELPAPVRADTPIDEFVMQYVYRHGTKVFPAVENGNHMIGWVDANNLKGMPRDQWHDHTVREFAHACGDSDRIAPSDDALTALKRMSQERKAHLCVMDHGQFVGVLSMEHLMKRLSVQLEMEGETQNAA